MRRAALLVAALIAGLTAVGCGTATDRSAAAGGARLRAVEFPQTPFVASVDAPPRAVVQASAKAHRRSVAVQAQAQAQTQAATGATGGDSKVAPGAPSDSEVRKQLAELYGASGGDANTGQMTDGLTRSVTLTDGEVSAPPDAPIAVQKIVDGGNQVARLPYVYGGGHGRGGSLFIDSAYDCSGSVSFALANAGLLKSPETSGQLESWGEAGQGKWVTVYANAVHAFMVVGGARFDTVGLQQTGSRWQRPFRSISGFVARHPAGL